MIDEIKTCIEHVLGDCVILVHNPNDDGRHFEAVVASDTFEGMPLVKQHQLVMGALKEKFDTSLHALRLKTLTKKEYEANQKEVK